jgi:hypothetical protein
MGIASKCFEILENKPPASREDIRDALAGSHNATNTTPIPGYQPLTTAGGMMLDEDDEDEVEEDEEEIMDEEADETESELSDEETDDDSEYFGESFDQKGRALPKLRLREILFYDDKVSIFRARHGRL